MNKKVIVTGGAGFIGSHLSERLVELGYEVHIVDNLIAGKREVVPLKATLHVVDIRNRDLLVPIFEGSQAVFHLAALPSVPYSIEHPIETHEVNTLGTLNVLMAAHFARVPRVIFSSSSAVYGDQGDVFLEEEARCRPGSPYGFQKFEGEGYMRLASELYGIETVSLRYFNLYGPRQNAVGPYASVIAKFLANKAQGKPHQIFGDGFQTRDFVHVADVVEANILALESNKVGKGEVINIGGGVAHTVSHIAELLGGEVIHLPPRIEIHNSVADINRATELLGWKPARELKTELKRLISDSM